MAKNPKIPLNIMLPPQNVLVVAKVAVIFYILVSPFINYQHARFMNAAIVKFLIIIGIVGACFVDFQLAILMTIAFVILMINMNTDIIAKAAAKNVAKPHDTFVNYPEPLFDMRSEVAVTPEDVPPADPMASADNVACANTERNNMNEDMATHFIDPKIKPYDVFISMIAEPSHLDAVQNAAIL
jgi:hypothetical protein